MFIHQQPVSIPPAPHNHETDRADAPLDGVAGGSTAEVVALPGADRSRSSRAKGVAMISVERRRFLSGAQGHAGGEEMQCARETTGRDAF